MSNSEWKPRLSGYSKTGLVHVDSDGEVVRDGNLERIYEHRKINVDHATDFMEEIARYIRIGAGDYRANMLAKSFEVYVHQIKNGVDPKIAAKNFTNELGITTSNKRREVPDSQIIEEMLRTKIDWFDSDGVKHVACDSINKSYNRVAKNLGISKGKVVQVWKEYSARQEEENEKYKEALSTVMNFQVKL